MKTRIINLWDTVLDSFWFVPMLLTLSAAVLFFVTRLLDKRVELSQIEGVWWIYTGGPDGAYALLSTVAGTVITVAGVVFSITIAALTLASSQFGPRLLRNFTHDTGNQVVLGTFVGTFLYCLLVLRTVRGAESGNFVPHISVAVGLLLGITSLGVLIYFIHHVATTIQATNIVAALGGSLCGAIGEIFPQHIGQEPPEQGRHPAENDVPPNLGQEIKSIKAPQTGYIQAIDPDALMQTLVNHDVVVRLLYRPGHFVVRGSDLMQAWPAERVDTKLTARLQAAFIIGKHRTRTQDVEFIINQLVEMAVRALSPAINDPFTAMACIDWLGSGLCGIAERGVPSRYRYDDKGRLRVIANPVTFEGIVDSAFLLIRQNGSSHAAVLIRMLETIAVIATHTRDDEQRAVLLEHAHMISRAAQTSLTEERDRQDVEERYRAVLNALGKSSETANLEPVL